MNKFNELLKYSNPNSVQDNMNKYLPNTKVYMSTRKDKKYMIKNLDNKWVHYGQMGYEDFTKHRDINRRTLYWKRATNIKGNWEENLYSPNMLSIMTLWT